MTSPPPDGEEHTPASDNVPSLRSLAQRACIRNIRAIVDIGDAPYELVRGVLLKLPNPDHLHILEQSSPQIIGHSAEIWRQFIRRDIEEYSNKEPPAPSDPTRWYSLYKNLRRKEADEIRQSVQALSAQLQGIQDEAAQHTSRQVSSASVPKLPRAPGMRVDKKPSTTAPKTADTSKLHFTSGSRTKTVTGHDVLNRARREAKEMSLFGAGGGTSKLAQPTHRLNSKATQLMKPPPSFAPVPVKGAAPMKTVHAPRRQAPAAVSSHAQGKARVSGQEEGRRPNPPGSNPSPVSIPRNAAKTTNGSASSAQRASGTRQPAESSNPLRKMAASDPPGIASRKDKAPQLSSKSTTALKRRIPEMDMPAESSKSLKRPSSSSGESWASSDEEVGPKRMAKVPRISPSPAGKPVMARPRPSPNLFMVRRNNTRTK